MSARRDKTVKKALTSTRHGSPVRGEPHDRGWDARMPRQLASVEDEILERLTQPLPAGRRQKRLGPRAQELVMEAFGSTVGTPPADPGEDDSGGGTVRQVRGARLRQLRVRGFRGIGPEVTLDIPASARLILVTGHNGSGKSSLCEALEHLLTGTSRRWDKRSAVWRAARLNVHGNGAERSRIQALFDVDGQAAPLTLTQTWRSDAADDFTLKLGNAPCAPDAGLKGLGWARPIERQRPFLTQNELGSLLESAPSTLFDAIAPILGLQELSDTMAALRAREKDAKQHVLEALRPLAELKEDTARLALTDQRAAEALSLLDRDPVPVGDLEALLLLPAENLDAASKLVVLQQLASLRPPERAACLNLAGIVTEVATRLERTAGTDAAAALRRARLLREALADHEQAEGPEPCPVCGGRILDEAWTVATRQEIAKLDAEATAARGAVEQARRAMAAARRLDLRPPEVLAQATGLGLDPDRLAASWAELADRWAAVEELSADDGAPSVEQLLEAAAALESVDLAGACRSLNERAQAEIVRMDEAWRPVARRLLEALPGWGTLPEDRKLLADLDEACKWLRKAAADLQEERFRPIAEQVRRNWERLRTTSSVSLEDVFLSGGGTRRSVDLKVAVDGREAKAFAVMSQAELNSLALSLFLPRATVPDSPFRFVVIDDPVQAMDPVKVDGLARLLDEVAAERQVLVFTHDERLVDAVRDLVPDVVIFEVEREQQSRVRVVAQRPAWDRVLDDAMRFARSDADERIKLRVVGGMAREAVEAAIGERVRVEWRNKGATWDQVHAALAGKDLRQRLAVLVAGSLATRARASDDQIIRRWDDRVRRVVAIANSASHDELRGDPAGFVHDARHTVDLIMGRS
jgi:energy-coupling factor transporter ATP-binding protein EcfA2